MLGRFAVGPPLYAPYTVAMPLPGTLRAIVFPETAADDSTGLVTDSTGTGRCSAVGSSSLVKPIGDCCEIGIAGLASAAVVSTALRDVSSQPVVYAELPFAQHSFDSLGSARAAHSAVAVEQFLAEIYANRQQATQSERVPSTS